MIVKALAVSAATTCVAAFGMCTAHADPPKFPDFSDYTAVNPADYRIDTTSPGVPSSRVVFLTPDGVPCSFLSGVAGCTGDNLPGIQAKDKRPYSYVSTDGGIRVAGSTPYVDNTVHGQPIKTLPAFHSITFNGATCGVDDSGTTACKDSQGRGFILSPSWSGWLPKV
jgi:hypothetical protein